MHSAIAPVPARRHPFQVLIAVLLTVSGVYILAGGRSPGSVQESLPTVLLLVWATVIAVGGAMVVAAAIVGPLLALYLEVMADPPLAVMCFVYAACIWAVAGSRGAMAASLTLAAALAFAVRAGQVIRSLVQLRRYMRRREGS